MQPRAAISPCKGALFSGWTNLILIIRIIGQTFIGSNIIIRQPNTVIRSIRQTMIYNTRRIEQTSIVITRSTGQDMFGLTRNLRQNITVITG